MVHLSPISLDFHDVLVFQDQIKGVLILRDIHGVVFHDDLVVDRFSLSSVRQVNGTLGTTFSTFAVPFTSMSGVIPHFITERGGQRDHHERLFDDFFLDGGKLGIITTTTQNLVDSTQPLLLGFVIISTHHPEIFLAFLNGEASFTDITLGVDDILDTNGSQHTDISLTLSIVEIKSTQSEVKRESGGDVFVVRVFKVSSEENTIIFDSELFGNISVQLRRVGAQRHVMFDLTISRKHWDVGMDVGVIQKFDTQLQVTFFGNLGLFGITHRVDLDLIVSETVICDRWQRITGCGIGMQRDSGVRQVFVGHGQRELGKNHEKGGAQQKWNLHFSQN
mmetsp:Transcript_43470/g.50016  ORF Transcript_43470/g.50016 Transcript_43470/m.50016 type:complete len:335 (-) Transcript_43470:107-1111(-)